MTLFQHFIGILYLIISNTVKAKVLKTALIPLITSLTPSLGLGSQFMAVHPAKEVL